LEKGIALGGNAEWGKNRAPGFLKREDFGQRRGCGREEI